MIYVALAIVVGWCFYSPAIGLSLFIMSLAFAVFYGGILTGYAAVKVTKAFSIIVFVISVTMGGFIAGSKTPVNDGPKYCSGVAC